MIQFFTPWYGWDSTCLKCGRKWCDDYWMELPFCSGQWGYAGGRIGKLRCTSYRFMKPREYNIEAAKLRWRDMPPKSENHYGLDQT
jgi:hypothetical protein